MVIDFLMGVGMYKRLTFAVVGAVALVVGLAAPAGAQGLKSPAPESLFWSEYGVSAVTQTHLSQKLAEGRPLDAQTRAVQPAASELRITPAAITTVATYPDGSITVTGVERPSTTVTHNADGTTTTATNLAGVSSAAFVGVKNCTVQIYSVTSIYSNCRVWYQDGAAVLFGFKTGFSLNRSAYDVINTKGVSDGATCVTSCSPPTFGAWKQNESNTGRAFVTWSVEWNGGGTISATLPVTLVVGADTYYAHT
jgi:hypothetical protein